MALCSCFAIIIIIISVRLANLLHTLIITIVTNAIILNNTIIDISNLFPEMSSNRNPSALPPISSRQPPTAASLRHPTETGCHLTPFSSFDESTR